jgi:xanthine phosphoribosyltransferase
MLTPIHPLSWHDISTITQKLSASLQQLAPFTQMIAVTRGGLVPAGLLAHHLNIKNIQTINVESYRDTTQGAVQFLGDKQHSLERCLVVDELVDTGKTLAAIRALFPNAVLATLYAKPLGKPFVDVFVEEVPQETWLSFPWEGDGEEGN